MNEALRCAIYSRFSSDNQRDASIDDQIRKCRQHAGTRGWIVLENHLYFDRAMSAAGSDRPGLQALLAAAFSVPRPFDVVLVDDTSRLSRNLGDIIRLQERLSFDGIRIVAVSQGIDSSDEQADVMFTVHGLVDTLYIKELSKKTHRGLEGLALKGFHTGGKCLGYRSVRDSDGARLEIDEVEAVLVRRIFKMYAAGKSVKRIAKILNHEGIKPQRTSRNKLNPSWCPGTIREILHRELYIGRVVWNKKKYMKKPGTNKRIARTRPKGQWYVSENPGLRVVPQELWEAVQHRFITMSSTFGKGRRKGLLTRAAGGPHLLSGLLKCAECGNNLIIIKGRGGDLKQSKEYGCPYHHNRGVCGNSLLERLDVIETRFLQGLQEAVLRPDAIEYTVTRLREAITSAAAQACAEEDALRPRREELNLEIKRLTEAIAAIGYSEALLDALRNKESELCNLHSQEQTRNHNSQDLGIVRGTDLAKFVVEQVADLRAVFEHDLERARAHLALHVREIRMNPTIAKGKRFYTAEFEWEVLGRKEAAQKQMDGLGAIESVHSGNIAGGGFEPPTFGL